MEAIANLSVSWVLYAVLFLTVLRLAFIRVPTAPMRTTAEYVESALTAIVLVFLLIRPFVVQAYFIPSPSMEPTLLGKDGSGDRILVNKFQYRFKGVDAPHRQDIVVFIPPPEALHGKLEEPNGAPVNFIKRLIGRPGDVIQAFHGSVLVNGVEFSHNAVMLRFIQLGYFAPDTVGPDPRADHRIKFTDQGVFADGKLVATDKLATILGGGPTAAIKVQPGYIMRNNTRLDEPYTAEDPDYDLQIFQGKPLKWLPDSDQTGEAYKLDGDPISRASYERFHAAKPEPVPAGHFFMMGDNRNDSEDSTEWGPLDARKVVGKAQFIFWPPNRVGAIK
jgi:signal peptidase I